MPAERVLIVHHDNDSLIGSLADPLRRLGLELVEHWVCETIDPTEWTTPPSGEFAALILLGSRWSVNDTQVAPWVAAENGLIGSFMANRIPILGICFGAQLLCQHLGGTVNAAEAAEVGWYEVDSPNHHIAPGPWFQWHFDQCLPPTNTLTLATSPTCVQAFRSGRAVGVQFHPELTPAVLNSWLDNDAHELVELGIDIDRLLAQTNQLAPIAALNAEALLRWWWNSAP